MRKTMLLVAVAGLCVLDATVCAAARKPGKPRKPARPRKAARRRRPAAPPSEEAAPHAKDRWRRGLSLQIAISGSDKAVIRIVHVVDGKTVRIARDGGGPIVVTRTERGRTTTREYKNADELRKSDGEAYKLYAGARASARGAAAVAIVGRRAEAGRATEDKPEAGEGARKGAGDRRRELEKAAAERAEAAERLRKQAEEKRRQLAERLRERHRAREADIHRHRLKEIEAQRARAKAAYERALKNIEEQLKREADRHAKAMKALERAGD